MIQEKVDDNYEMKMVRELRHQCSTPPKYCLIQDKELASSSSTIQAIFYDGLHYQGKPTKIFAHLGIPHHCNKLPGIVLVHGGGGTAYTKWVQLWNDRGYVALSIAVEGQTDQVVPGDQRINAKASQDVGRNYPLPQYKQHDQAGPARVGIYHDSTTTENLKDQWMYHAVSATLLGRSFLASLVEVDDAQIGIMGISWGACITSTAVGIVCTDNSSTAKKCIAFAIHVYGCGNLAMSENFYGASLKNNLTYTQLWDPALRLDQNTTIPQFWLSWPGDLHFSLDCFAHCYRLGTAPKMMSLVPGLGHGHECSWRREEPYAFADSVISKEAKPWCVEIIVNVDNDSFREDASPLMVLFSSIRPLQKSYLVSTKARGFPGNRHWVKTELELTMDDRNLVGEGHDRHYSYKINVKLPAFTKAWFVNVVDSNGLVASSDYHNN